MPSFCADANEVLRVSGRRNRARTSAKHAYENKRLRRRSLEEQLLPKTTQHRGLCSSDAVSREKHTHTHTQTHHAQFSVLCSFADDGTLSPLIVPLRALPEGPAAAAAAAAPGRAACGTTKDTCAFAPLAGACSCNASASGLTARMGATATAAWLGWRLMDADAPADESDVPAVAALAAPALAAAAASAVATCAETAARRDVIAFTMAATHESRSERAAARMKNQRLLIWKANSALSGLRYTAAFCSGICVIAAESAFDAYTRYAGESGRAREHVRRGASARRTELGKKQRKCSSVSRARRCSHRSGSAGLRSSM